MRWYETNSEQLDVIDLAVLEYRNRLVASVESSQKAGLSRAYEQESARLKEVDAAMFVLGDIRLTDRDN